MDSLLLVLVSILGTALAGTGAHAWFSKNKLTKKEHEGICEGKQALVFEKLDNIKEQQDKMDKKLDRILFNGRNAANPRRT